MGSFDLFVASVFKVCMQVLTDNVRVKLVVANMRRIVRIYPQPWSIFLYGLFFCVYMQRSGFFTPYV
jgi:hypothetical protein